MKKRTTIVFGATSITLLAAACSGGTDVPDAATDASPDTSMPDAAKDVVTNDVVTDAAADVGCPKEWTTAPVLGTTALTPDGGLPPNVVLHTFATGTQNYACQSATSDGGATYSWTFVGPVADLADCNQNLVGHHFASDAGPTAPEWLTLDNSYVIAKKAAAYTPDGGSGSIPWLLLQSTSTGGSGAISKTVYLHRVFTAGGNAPASGCDQNSVDASSNVPYTADYYFYGN